MWDSLASLIGGRHRRLCSICSTIPLAQDVTVCRCRELIFLCELCATWWQYRDTKYREIWHIYDRIVNTIGLYKVENGNSPQDLLFPATLRCWRGAQCPAAKIPYREEEPPTELSASANMLAGMTLQRTGTDSQSSHGFGEDKYYKRVSDEKGSPSRSKTAPHGALLAPDKEEGADFMGKECRGEVRSWCGWCDMVIRSRQDEAEHEAGMIRRQDNR